MTRQIATICSLSMSYKMAVLTKIVRYNSTVGLIVSGQLNGNGLTFFADDEQETSSFCERDVTESRDH